MRVRKIWRILRIWSVKGWRIDISRLRRWCLRGKVRWKSPLAAASLLACGLAISHKLRLLLDYPWPRVGCMAVTLRVGHKPGGLRQRKLLAGAGGSTILSVILHLKSSSFIKSLYP